MQQRNNSNTDHGRVIISSRANPAVKAIRALSNRKQRDSSGRFFVDGLHLVAAAAQQQAAIELYVVAPELLTSAFGRELARMLAQSGTQVLEVTADVFHSLAAKEHAQGLGIVARQRWLDLAHIRPAARQCWVALDTVQYPGNLGTIFVNLIREEDDVVKDVFPGVAAPGETVTYQIVGEKEADLKANKISISSPIGQGLLGKQKGEVAEVRAPTGIIKFKVEEISL